MLSHLGRRAADGARVLAEWQRLAFAAVVVGGLGIAFRQDLWGLGHEVLDVSIIERHGADAAILARIPVSECANRTPVAIAEDAGVPAIRQGLADADQRAVPVVARDGRLRGMIVPAEIRDALLDPGLSGLAIAADLAVPRYEALTLDDSLRTALRLFGRYDVDVLPVLAARDSERLAGTITRQEAWAVYERHLLEAQEQGAGTR